MDPCGLEFQVIRPNGSQVIAVKSWVKKIDNFCLLYLQFTITMITVMITKITLITVMITMIIMMNTIMLKIITMIITMKLKP